MAIKESSQPFFLTLTVSFFPQQQARSVVSCLVREVRIFAVIVNIVCPAFGGHIIQLVLSSCLPAIHGAFGHPGE
jgi:hypothetical protein